MKATTSGKNIVASGKKGILVLFHGHLHTDVPSRSFAFSIDATEMAANKTRDPLSNPQNLVSVTTCGSVLELQVRHAKSVVDLPNAYLFDHTDTGIVFQALDDIADSIWIRRMLVAHE